MSDIETKKSGFIAILGFPNAGKSTLVNALVGQKVSIVTHKVQTTRTQIRGIADQGNTQVILLDTPGLIKPKVAFEKSMMAAAHDAIEQSDAVLCMIDVSNPQYKDQLKHITKLISDQKKPCYLVINKCDKIAKDQLLPITAELQSLHDWAFIFMISASKEKGTKDIIPEISKVLPESPWLYDSEQIMDASLAFWAAEITREKLFLNMHKELPYGCSVETETMQVDEEKDQLVINQVIYTQKEAHKRMIIGKGGQSLKRIGSQARKDLEEALGQKIFLDVFVKVSEAWKTNPERLKAINLDHFGE